MTTGDSNFSGRWVTDRVFSERYSIPRQTLSNWRFKDRKAGRIEAPAGYPRYRYFGGAVRYFIEVDQQPESGRAA